MTASASTAYCVWATTDPVSCKADGDCGTGGLCVKRYCEPAPETPAQAGDLCKTQADCATGNSLECVQGLCQPKQEVAPPPCQSDADCRLGASDTGPGDGKCVSGVCVWATTDPLSCKADGDCGTGGLCVKGYCEPAPETPAQAGDDIARALESLPEEFRTVVILCDIEGLSYEEIAEFVDCPIGTVRSRLHRGRKILRGMLLNYARKHGFVDGSGD